MKAVASMRSVRPGLVAASLARPQPDSVMVLLIVAAGVIAMLAFDPYSIKLIAKVFALWIVVLGLQLLISHAGVITLGHAAFLALGGYVAGAFSRAGEHPLWLVLAAVVVASVLLGGAVGAVVLRTRGMYQLMATLSIGQMAFYGFQSLRSLGGDDGFALTVRPGLPAGLSLESDSALGLTIVVLAAVLSWAVQRLRASELGLAIQAARDDERRVASLGVSPYWIKLAAFVVAAVFAGLGGAMLAHLSRFTNPQLGHWMMSGELMVLVLLGGGRLRAGSFAACAVVVAVQELLSQYTEHWPLALGVLALARVLWPSSSEARA